MYAELHQRLTRLSQNLAPELELYLVDISGSPTTDAPFQCLSDTEQARAARFKRPHLAPRFILARSTLRLLLSEALSCTPAEVELDAAEQGRPFIRRRAESAGANTDFNLSHSADRALIALNSGQGQVGVDIELCKPVDDLQRLAKSVLTTAELATLRSSDDINLSRFYQYWTLKESYLKALGTGLQLAPKRIEIELGGPHMTRCPAEPPALLHGFTPCPGYQAALTLISG